MKSRPNSDREMNVSKFGMHKKKRQSIDSTFKGSSKA